jgi:hypothetical protein
MLEGLFLLTHEFFILLHLEQSWCSVLVFLWRVALDSLAHALLEANNWDRSFAKALVDMGYPFLFTPGTEEVIDSLPVRHLLTHQLVAFFPYWTIFTLGHVHPLVS